MSLAINIKGKKTPNKQRNKKHYIPYWDQSSSHSSSEEVGLSLESLKSSWFCVAQKYIPFITQFHLGVIFSRNWFSFPFTVCLSESWDFSLKHKINSFVTIAWCFPKARAVIRKKPNSADLWSNSVTASQALYAALGGQIIDLLAHQAGKCSNVCPVPC